MWVLSLTNTRVGVFLQYYQLAITKMDLNHDEAMIVRAGLNALEASARSDEPHYAHTPGFSALYKKVAEYLKL